MNKLRDTVSIVIPVFNSEKILAETVRQTVSEMEKLDVDFELLLVDDGSLDDSWTVAKECATCHKTVKAIQLLRNYGQHTAVYCGIAHAVGDFVVTMDDDLQNPPEEIIKLLETIRDGYDLVFAKFDSKNHAEYRRLGTKVIGYLNEKIFRKPEDIVLTNFRIFTREVAQRLLEYRGYQPYIPGLLITNSSRIGNVLTRHESRSIGKSNYDLRTILSLVSRLLFNYSSYPLRLLSIIGGLVALVSFLWGGYAVTKQLIIGIEVPGWTTLVVLLAFLNGLILLTMGVLGEYVVRLITTVSTAKSYQVSSVVE